MGGAFRRTAQPGIRLSRARSIGWVALLTKLPWRLKLTAKRTRRKSGRCAFGIYNLNPDGFLIGAFPWTAINAACTSSGIYRRRGHVADAHRGEDCAPRLSFSQSKRIRRRRSSYLETYGENQRRLQSIHEIILIIRLSRVARSSASGAPYGVLGAAITRFKYEPACGRERHGGANAAAKPTRRRVLPFFSLDVTREPDDDVPRFFGNAVHSLRHSGAT